MSQTNNNPDPYRENEANITNFADHIREKAIQEKMSVSDMAQQEVDRFRDVVFGVNTQFSGSQLRLRDYETGKVITKLKPGAQIKIIGKIAETMDDDRTKNGVQEEHVWVNVEVDAADTEAGGIGKVQGWVSTEYIRSLSEPLEPVVIDPALDNPESRESNPIEEPDPFKVIDDAKKEKPAVPTIPDASATSTNTTPNVPTIPDASATSTNTTPNVPIIPDASATSTNTTPNVPTIPDASGTTPDTTIAVPRLTDTPGSNSNTTPQIPKLNIERADGGKEVPQREDSPVTPFWDRLWKSLEKFSFGRKPTNPVVESGEGKITPTPQENKPGIPTNL